MREVGPSAAGAMQGSPRERCSSLSEAKNARRTLGCLLTHPGSGTTVQRMVPGDDPVWLAQLRRGSVEHCVLALLSNGERYGFELARTLANAGGLIGSEGTIYPLLARLRRNGQVETTWRESLEGPPRRYYRLTESGDLALAAFVRHWTLFRDAIDRILEEASAA